ncbi:probable G-protein coupled receptor 179 [Cuculus canorus]|uniref:probable G-protein coupled receptor 179 n=1 Tax=Cuculus canorus TaxID=55661 RepID=UPI0023AAB9D0|nr:probable G-protein coupled receptor 179 [Cuculus canorus]
MGPRRGPLLLWCLQAALIHGSILGGAQLPPESPPRPAGWSPSPSSSWAPTPEPGAPVDPEGSLAALAFLQTGDAQRLARVNCSRSVPAAAAGAVPPPALRATLRAAPEALAHAANFLNMLFQTNDIREASVGEDVEWYQALVRSLVEGHPWVRRAVLALDAHPLAAKPRLMLQATKGDGEILLRDVSAAAPDLANLSWDNEWFNALKSQRTPLLRKRVLSNDLRSMETPKWQRGDSYVGESGHVRWSPPFLECRDGRFLPAWTITLSSAFYGLKPDLSPEFKGVVRVDIDLRDVAIDQCASGTGWFADTHRCDLNSTQCVPQESHGFVLGRYLCRCKPGFYGVGGAASGARAGAADGGSRLACRPCRPGCSTCEDDAPCLIQEDRALRAAVLSCQACCMLAVFLSMLVSYHFRRSKRIRASGVVLLETILFGSLLLYFPVFILYFKPSIFRCIVLRWVRMLGFAIVYGTITLKLYRVLKVFLSRTAQRVPYVSSGRVLKMLGLILLLVLWFLAAWTIGMLENIDKNIPLVIRTQTARGLHFYICGHDRWDYMMVIAEMLFLLWGSFLCYAMRAVPSAFHEPRYMGIALHNELMISTAFHVVRFIMVPSLHPDWTLLLFFAHTHGTITMTLALLFIPKFLHAGSPLREEIAAEVYEDELDMRHSGSCLNSSIASAWSEHSLDPDDIREELKKLYTQLEVHKTWSMAANNPHLPKKRSSRRSLGRSIMHRIAELPEAVARRSSRGERVGTPARRRSSAKWLPNAGGASLRLREDGARHRAAALPKSHSTEGPAREPPGGSPTLGIPGEPAPEGNAPAATASEQSDSESLDAAPLVCKSASAHNLAGHEQPPPPLQKSLSVVAGARDEALLAASRAAREKRHRDLLLASEPPREAGKLQSPGAAGAPQAGSPSPAEGGSQEIASPPSDGKVQKHVTYAPIKSVSIDSSHAPGRVRVAVKRTPPPPPIRCQSLGQRAMPAADSQEHTEPRADPQEPPREQVGELEKSPEGPGEEESGHVTSPVGKSTLPAAAAIPAQVCPWELVQEEILSRKQKASEAADSGTPGDAAAEAPSLKMPPQKISLRGLGLALKAFNRTRAKSILKGRREGEGSLGKRGHERGGGSGRERPSLAVTAAVSLGGISRAPSSKSPEWSRQRPSSEPGAQPWHGDTVPCQHNNNAGSTGEAAGWGDSGAGGQQDSPTLGLGDGEKPAEQLSTPGDAPVGVHKIAPSVGHQEGAEHPQEVPAVASSEETQLHPQQEAKSHVAETGKDVPAGMVGLITPKEGMAGVAKGLEGSSSSIHHPRDQAEVEKEQTKPIAHSPSLSTARAAAEKPGAEVCPQGPPGTPAGRAALLRQEAITPWEDSEVPRGEESPAKASSQPEPLDAGGSWGAERVPPRNRSVEAAPAALEKGGSAAGRRAEVCPWEIQADSSLKSEICPWEENGGERWESGEGRSEGVCGEELGTEKPPAEPLELPKAALEKAGSAEGRRAEVCPWESGEGERTVRAEICPWDAEGAQPERERQQGERRRLDKWRRSIRPRSLGLLRAQESGSSPQAPHGARGSEGPTAKPAPKSSTLPEVTSRSPTSTRASVCPWEAAGANSDAEEVCPWERGTASSDGGKSDDSDISHMENRISLQKAASRGVGETALAAGKESGQQGSPLPREGVEKPGTGVGAKHPVLPKAASKQAGDIDSRKANICPWEGEGEPPATEICPWEEPAAPSGKETPSQNTRGTCKAENKPRSGGLEGIRAKLAEMGASQPARRDTGIFAKLAMKSLESLKVDSKKSRSMESIKEEICPWESMDVEQHLEQSRARSPALPKSPSSKSQSEERRKAEVCPWEAPGLESMDKAEICPWEVAAAPSDQLKAKQGPGDAPKVEKRITRQAALASPVRSLEKGSSERDAVCPWESPGTEQRPEKPHTGSPALPKSPSEKSQSEESRKAEVCPWEAAEVTTMDKAEICPWESPGTEQHLEHPCARSPALPKPPSSKSQDEERRKAEVCPWEAPELKSMDKAEICPWEAPELKSMDKAEICPWEGAAPPSSKGKSREDKAGLSIGSRSPSTGQITLKKTGESVSGKKEGASGDRESICPWESPGTEQHPEHPCARSPALPKSPTSKSQSEESWKAEVCPWEAVEVKSMDKAEICPWESPGMEQHLEQPRARSPALPKSPSSKSQSEERRKAEVCPWEAPGLESMDKAEICPWEAAAPLSSKGKSKEDKAGLSIGSRSPSTVRDLSNETGKSPSGKKEGASGDRESICPWESLDTESSSAGYGLRSTELLKGTAEKTVTLESTKAEICPWESTGTERPTAKPRARGTVLPKSPSSKSQSQESRKAEVCPWEAAELESVDKAEICPWEAAVPPSGVGKSREDKAGLSIGSRSPSTGQITLKKTGESTTGMKEGASGDRESICPWESPGTEQHPEHPRARSPALPKSPSSKSQSTESRKAEVCPWEAPELESMDKAEICPWEVAAAPSNQLKAKQGPGDAPKAEKRITRQAALASPVRSLEKGSSERDAVCPWESAGTEQRPEKPHTGSPALPKSPSEKSQSEESRKAEVCPWEAAGVKSMDKAEICPWERPGTEQHPEHPRARSPALPKSPSSKSQSEESRKAEVCPWEAPELKSMDKAEICPWEAAVPPSAKGKSKEDKAGLTIGSRSPSTGQITLKKTGESASGKKEGASGDRESICPWESPGTEQHPEHPRARSPALPKSPTSKSQSQESRKAEVCPWEAVEVKSMDKAEICPWEVAAAPSDQLKAKQGPGDAPKAEKRITRQAALASPARSLEKGSSERDAVCPWESLGTEQRPEKPHTRSPALPKSPSEKSQSEESRKAEVCPWEAAEVKSMDKAEICPWEAAVPPSGKGKSREDKAGLTIGSRSPSTGHITLKKTGESTSGKKEGASGDRESICPWESPGTEQHPEHPRARSPALPKSPSSKSQSEESRKTEVCPWEAVEVKSMDKAEICPWEVTAAPSDQLKAKQGPGDAPKAEKRITRQAALASPARSLEKGSSERDAVCPWESPGTEQRPEKPHTRSPALPKSPSEKSQSEESRKAEVCPWEAPELKSTDKAEICPWEGTAPPLGKARSGEDKAGLSIGSRSPSTGQITLKKTGESTTGKKEGASGDRESICPWESPGTEQHPEHPRARSPALPKSPSSKSQSEESRKTEVCPWEAMEVKSMDKAEICPWEAAAPSSGKVKSREEKADLTMGTRSPSRGQGLGKETGQSPCGDKEGVSGDRESICPWESLDAEQPSLKSAVGKEPSKTSGSSESRRSDICPWEAAEPSSSEKEIFQPGVQPQGADRASPAGTGQSKLAAGASTVSPAPLQKSKSRSDGEAKHKPLCRILPGIQPPQGQRAEPWLQGASAGSSPSGAKVCPWETEEALPANAKTSTDPRNISQVCPWEVGGRDPIPTLREQGRDRVSPEDGGSGMKETKPDVCPRDHE